MKTKKVILLASILMFFAYMIKAQDLKYIGASKCKMCHNSEKSGQQFKNWSESKHASAMLSLKSEKALEYAKKNNIGDPSKEPKCLKCHSTASGVDAGKLESITIDEGVSCESCHGPGSAYKAMNIMKDHDLCMKNGLIIPTQELCEKCHNKENPFYKPFDFKTSVEKISHPRPKS
jgi:hypothetical protein